MIYLMYLHKWQTVSLEYDLCFSIWKQLDQGKRHQLWRKLGAIVCCWAQSCSTLCGPVDIASQAPLSMAFSRQEYWGGLTCPPPEDLPEPRIKLTSLMSPALAVGFFTTNTTWKGQRQKDQSLNPDNTVYQKCDLGKCLNICLWALSFPICERGTVVLSL